MAVNYAEAYSKELANAYGYTLYFGKLWSTDNTDKYKPVDAKSIKIAKIKTGGRVDGSRDSLGAFTRNWDNDWETKNLNNHRIWQTLVHPNDRKHLIWTHLPKQLYYDKSVTAYAVTLFYK